MSIRTFIRVTAVAAGVIAMTSAAAVAFSPFNIPVIKASKVYASRNMASQVVNRIQKDEIVKVMQIYPHWCYIQIPGDDGWVKCDVLATFY
jgi:hypothetical protein